MARKPLIAGNWKMNNTISEAVVLAQEISNIFEKDYSDFVDTAVCPPYVDLKPVNTVFEFDKCRIGVGAQNVYWEKSGAYTGEISVPMLKSCGCTYCIVGHSERRQYFGETNEDVNKKVKALVEDQLDIIVPIVCVGESLHIRDEGTYVDFVDKQVRAAFAGLDGDEIKSAVVAYEPIWAIGTGRTATPEQAQEVCKAIRDTLSDLFGDDVSQGIRVLYGGSMNEGNAASLLAMQDIDGGLIGGASLKAGSFIEIVKEGVKASQV